MKSALLIVTQGRVPNSQLYNVDCPTPIKGTVTQKVLLFFMIKNSLYSAGNLKFYMYFKYIQEKM